MTLHSIVVFCRISEIVFNFNTNNFMTQGVEFE